MYALSAIIAAGVLSSLWGIYYIVLRYTVDAEGITRRSIWCKKRILWQDVTAVSYSATDSQGVASCCLVVSTPTLSFTLSSELLVPDAVRDLANDLHKIGMLKDAPTPTE